MIDLNGSEFNKPTISIFNNGVAGKVDNVSISVEKRKIEDPDNAPAYKVIFTDSFGSINMGIYYPTENSTESQNKLLSQKCADLVKATVGNDFVFPSFNDYKELVDGCMKIIAQNSLNAKVNVFATYGTLGYPKKFLGIYKNFNFVEKSDTQPTTLRLVKGGKNPQYDDLMERIIEDSPSVPLNESQTKPELPW